MIASNVFFTYCDPFTNDCIVVGISEQNVDLSRLLVLFITLVRVTHPSSPACSPDVVNVLLQEPFQRGCNLPTKSILGGSIAMLHVLPNALQSVVLGHPRPPVRRIVGQNQRQELRLQHIAVKVKRHRRPCDLSPALSPCVNSTLRETSKRDLIPALDLHYRVLQPEYARRSLPLDQIAVPQLPAGVLAPRVNIPQRLARARYGVLLAALHSKHFVRRVATTPELQTKDGGKDITESIDWPHVAVGVCPEIELAALEEHVGELRAGDWCAVVEG